jgi:Uma2 family endonuclease
MARTEAAVADLTPDQKMTFEEYLEWHPEARVVEWVDGDVIVHPLPGYTHQELVTFLAVLLRIFCEVHRLGKVLVAGFPMKLGPPEGGSAREPDVLFISHERANQVRGSHMVGASDVAVEIVSPESGRRDRLEKYAEYEAAGVREYWLIEPQRREVHFYVLNSNGSFTEAPLEDGVFHSSALPGFWLRIEWLWADPLPGTLETLREIGAL